jgi:hypothetical protein
MEAGEERTVTFKVNLNLAAGSFHVGVALYRYDISHQYDQFVPASTVLIRSPMDVGGAANLYPELVDRQAEAPARIRDKVG